MKTVRFSKIVSATGQPEPYTLWMPAEKDRDFQSAVKAHRVMTVHHNNVGSKADAGEVGYVKSAESILLVFPKSLKRFEGKRVVGINYDLLKMTEPEKAPKPSRKEATKPKPKPAKVKLAKPNPPIQKFEPLRVFTPEPKKEAPPKQEQGKPDDGHERLERLTAEVRKALKKLENGNAVAAYKILEKSLPTT